MGIKKYNPYTPSRRHMTGSDFSEITKDTPEKSLIGKTIKKSAGRFAKPGQFAAAGSSYTEPWHTK